MEVCSGVGALQVCRSVGAGGVLGSFKSAGSSGLGGRVDVAMIRCKDIFVYKS